MDKQYDEWNEVKKDLSTINSYGTFKVREIYWLKVGKNVGFETNGKGKEFLRPVLIFRKFSRNSFLGIPLTTSVKDDMFHYDFILKNNDKLNYASLSQIKLFDTKRIKSKLGKMEVDDFENLKDKLKILLELV